MLFAMVCGQCGYELTTDEPVILEEARRRLKEHARTAHRPPVRDEAPQNAEPAGSPQEPAGGVDAPGRMGHVGRR